MKTIKQSYLINASLADVWQALTDPAVIDKWGGDPARMDDKVGTEFTLWGGDIYGKNIYSFNSSLQLSLTDYVPKILFKGCKLEYFEYKSCLWQRIGTRMVWR